MRRENLLLLETVEEFSGDLADRIVVANVPFAGDDHAFVFLALRHVTGLSYTWSAPSRVQVKNCVEPPIAVAMALRTPAT